MGQRQGTKSTSASSQHARNFEIIYALRACGTFRESPKQVPQTSLSSLYLIFILTIVSAAGDVRAKASPCGSLRPLKDCDLALTCLSVTVPRINAGSSLRLSLSVQLH